MKLNFNLSKNVPWAEYIKYSGLMIFVLVLYLILSWVNIPDIFQGTFSVLFLGTYTLKSIMRMSDFEDYSNHYIHDLGIGYPNGINENYKEVRKGTKIIFNFQVFSSLVLLILALVSISRWKIPFMQVMEFCTIFFILIINVFGLHLFVKESYRVTKNQTNWSGGPSGLYRGGGGY